jgi:membrane protein implicated in regulation of membrane protease activity
MRVWSAATDSEFDRMLRTIFMIGLFAIGGLFLLKLIFGIFGVFFALLVRLLMMAVWVGIVGFVIYLVIRIVSPDTARKLRERWSRTTA